MIAALGSPTLAVADAIRTALLADASLAAVVGTKVYAHLPEASRTAYPFIVIGRRHVDGNDGVPMGTYGGKVTVQLDAWSDLKGPYQAHVIEGHVVRVLDRQRLRVTGYAVTDGSLTHELSEVFDEDDPDKPEARLYHLVQRWACEVTEAA